MKIYELRNGIISQTAILLLALSMTSCGSGGKHATYAVTGRITLADGSPLAGARVLFQSENPPVVTRARTDANGNYSLGTYKAGDGAPAGDYRIVIVQSDSPLDPQGDATRRFHQKYGSLERSGLSFTVKEEANAFDMQLEPRER